MKSYNVTFLIGLMLVIFTSCKKEPITPGNYQVGTQPNDTTNWQSQYGNGGTVPTWTTSTSPNQTNGTNWVVTDVYYNYAHTPKSDTVHFISNNRYRINSDTTKYVYNLYQTMGNSTIELNTFMPINGLNLSANNFNANAFTTTPVGGTIQLVLKDILSTNSIYTTTLKKI